MSWTIFAPSSMDLRPRVRGASGTEGFFRICPTVQCGKSCISETRLRCHEREYHGRLKCQYCREEVGRDAMEAHVTESHPDKVFAKKWKEQAQESDAEDASAASDYAPTSSEDSDDDANSDSEADRKDKKTPRKKRKRSNISRRKATYKCTDCSEEFCEIPTFAKHRKDAHDATDIYKCHICLRSFTTGGALKIHLLKQKCVVSDAENFFKCFECGERFKTAGELGNHRRDIHGAENNLYVCHICLYNCKYSSQLKVHIMGHIGARDIKCSKCEAGFKTNPALKFHMLRVHKVLLVTNLNKVSSSCENVLYRCRKCRMEFEEREKLIEHGANKHGDFALSCDRCDATFWDKSQLNSHMLKHGNPKLKCRHCEKMFFNSAERNYHEKFSHNDTSAGSSKVHADNLSELPATDGAFKCSQCPMTFDRGNELSVHVACLHSEKPDLCIKCDHCEKTYRHESSLWDHKLRFHGLLKCKYCRQEVQRDAMSAHVAESHAEKLLPKKPKVPRVKRAKKSEDDEDDEIDYHCSDCNEILKSLRTFRSHRQTHGLGPEEIYKCYICLKIATGSDKRPYFRLHMKKHNERTDWPCPHCSLRFVERTHRKEHQTQVHGPRPDDDPDGMLPLPPAQTLHFIAGETTDLRRKRRKGSEKIEPFKCVDCDLEFERVILLGNHRALVHGCPLEERYQCHHCLKICPSSNALHVHAQIHKEATPHLCEMCGKSFKMKDYLLQHYRLMHTENERKVLKERWKQFRMKKAAEKKEESA